MDVKISRYILLGCSTSLYSRRSIVLRGAVSLRWWMILVYVDLGIYCATKLLVWVTCPAVSEAASTGWFTCRGKFGMKGFHWLVSKRYGVLWQNCTAYVCSCDTMYVPYADSETMYSRPMHVCLEYSGVLRLLLQLRHATYPNGMCYDCSASTV